MALTYEKLHKDPLAICFKDTRLGVDELTLPHGWDWVEVMSQQTCPAGRNDLSPLEVTTWAQEKNFFLLKDPWEQSTGELHGHEGKQRDI